MRLENSCQLSTPTAFGKTSDGTNRIPLRVAEIVNDPGTCCCGQIGARLQGKVQSQEEEAAQNIHSYPDDHAFTARDSVDS